MEKSSVRFPGLAAKTMVCHTVTYMVMGLLAAHFLHYAARMGKPGSVMRPFNSAWVMAGPLFQPIRGFLYALVFYPLRERLFGRKDGWLVMSWLLVGLGILGTFAAAPGSLEGFIYTPTPPLSQFLGYLEVVPQALLLSALLCYWVNHAGRKWLNWMLGIVFFIMMALPVMGLLVRR